MKKLILLTIIAFTSFNLGAQSEIDLINKTLNDYIEGTANGEPSRLRRAFQPDFNLFLVSADTLRIIDGDQYIANVEEGKNYNRKSNVIAIDYENNSAMAKIQVYFPETKRIATDYLMLLKVGDAWKIVHKLINVKSLDAFDSREESIDNFSKIQETLQHYIQGTANGEPERIRTAFHEDLNLYYIKDGSISVIPGDRYISNFKPGKRNNRIGKIISVDYEHDVAMAKIEVNMPDRSRIAVDYMVLLKIDGQWKIIHKMFTDRQ